MVFYLYNADVSKLQEPDSAPHPLDVLAIFSLYQSPPRQTP